MTERGTGSAASDGVPGGERAGRGRRWRRRLGVTLAVVLLAAAGLYVGNSSTLAGASADRPFLLAHRGLAQTFDLAGVANDTCTAERIHPPQHPYLENTLASMRAAYAAGADQVEFDVQVTRDGRLAVFHDATLQCRTDGTGTIADHTLAELRGLDLGYGYTSDGGRTFPFRGAGTGLLPTADEVLAEFPDRELLIHLKVERAAEGEALADLLATLPQQRRRALTVYGGDVAVAAFAARLPDVRVTSKKIMQDCLVPYLAGGWTGHVPDACRHRQLHLPQRYGRLMWGWPNRFVARMREADTRVVLVNGSGEFSEGFDDPDDVPAIPAGWAGGVWTNRIDVVAPLLGR
ncbi:glycerophosphodiester phosphodiesterase family protein [Micromonospora sp. WMMD712]|uniref:glycerophosphodiester phosphodiesterase family protein n=1 Tax=Micromonospora sp. WMMD712 TaxID=3016096 RepID=UPI00249B77B8|nr:glycerophosphodiester phosphodiesterase family protein [Micromonospora sp. WMMD712]WFE56976.1 glycerophosphodiester phosphodiesterase family protein [Micromonospora sp. WMMD712]